jgi:osmotically-inducible protein OsmY
VHSQEERQAAEEAAREVEGVTHVLNDLVALT